MLAAGLQDGNIAVYNLQRDCGHPAFQSCATNGKHTDTVWKASQYF